MSHNHHDAKVFRATRVEIGEPVTVQVGDQARAVLSIPVPVQTVQEICVTTCILGVPVQQVFTVPVIEFINTPPILRTVPIVTACPVVTRVCP